MISAMRRCGDLSTARTDDETVRCFGRDDGFVGWVGETGNGKGEMRGSLHCATDGETVRCFGRDGGFWVGGRNRQRQRRDAGISPLRERTVRLSVASVEMTVFGGWVGETGNGKGEMTVFLDVIIWDQRRELWVCPTLRSGLSTLDSGRRSSVFF